jgi:pyruvate ferredoxin oxidoreductase beta subunit
MTKVQKAVTADGPSFINVITPCQRGWRYDPSQTIVLSKLATDTCIWSLYEVENGVWKLNYRPSPKKPVTEYLQVQGRFSHLLRPENREVVEALQQRVDEEWARLEERCKVSAAA